MLGLVNDLDKEVAIAKSGIVLLYDCKDAEETDKSELIEDSFFIAMYEFFLEKLANEIDLELISSEKELVQIFYDDAPNYVCLRVKDVEQYKSAEDVLAFCREIGFWMPLGIFIDGEFHDTYHLSPEDENGKAIGVRF